MWNANIFWNENSSKYHQTELFNYVIEHMHLHISECAAKMSPVGL